MAESISPSSDPEVAAAAAVVTPANGHTDHPTGLIFHHLENSRSQRILWLLEELEVPYTIKIYKRTAEQLAPPELKAVHPLGKAPVITDGDITLAESGAIVSYLINKYGRGRFDAPAKGSVDDLYFTHFAEGTLTHLLQNMYIYTIIPERSPFFIRFLVRSIFASVRAKLVDPQMIANKAMIESHLEKVPKGWFAGGDEPTAADFMMLFPLETMGSRVGGLGPKTTAWISQAHERPAYKRALEKGGKYDYL